jgi:hypothetical protein
VNLEGVEIVKRYLAGELDLEAAAESLHLRDEFGLYYSAETTSAEDRERIENLFGRVLWLKLRESSPNNVPDQPFGAAEIRAILNDTFFDALDEAPNQIDDSDPKGTL